MTDGHTPASADAPPAADRRTRSRVIGMAGLVSAAFAAAGVLAHFVGPVSTVVTLLATFTPIAICVGVVAVVGLAIARWWRSASVALTIVVVGVAGQVPLFVGTAAAPSPGAPTITVMQANIRLGEADPDALVSRVRDHDVEVLTVAELTEPAAVGLAGAGLQRLLPFSYLYPREGGGGAGIYSRYPLTDGSELPGLQHSNLYATLHPPGVAPAAIYALHPLPPYPEPSWRWAQELQRIGDILSAQPKPLIVGADFNSTYDHERYRRLLQQESPDGAALVDAAEYLGSGIVATYPAHRWFPAVLALDRVLTRGAVPLSFERVDLPGSDHHGVVADIALTGVR